MKITIVIVSFNRSKLLLELLQSLKQQDPHHFEFEIIIVLNGDDSETLTSLVSHSESLQIIELKKGLPPGAARNLAIEKASGEYLVFLDDDITLPRFYFSLAQTELKASMDLFGGPDITPLNGSFFQKALGLAQQSPLSSAHTRYRHEEYENISLNQSLNSKRGSEFILCNLWVRKSFLIQHHLKFDDRFFRNEENVLIHQMRQYPHTFCFQSRLFVYHQKKKNIQQLCRAVFSSGYHRIKSFAIFPDSFEIIYLTPAFFVLYLISLSFLWHLPYAVLPLQIYLIMNLMLTYRLTSRKEQNLRFAPLVFLLQIVMNLSYGIGTLYGVARWSLQRLRLS